MAVSSTTNSSAPKGIKSLLIFSADSQTSIEEAAAKVQADIEARPESLADIANNLGQKQQHGPHKAFAVTDGTSPLKLSPVVEKKSEAVLSFVFTGLGAQWPRMAADLFENFESFRKDVRVMDRALQTLPHPPLWTIEGKQLSLIVMKGVLTRWKMKSCDLHLQAAFTRPSSLRPYAVPCKWASPTSSAPGVSSQTLLLVTQVVRLQPHMLSGDYR